MGIFILTVFFACHTEKPPESPLAVPTENSLSKEEWKEKLSPMEYKILREKGTERAFTGDLLKEDRNGVYACAACGEALFDSHDKFNSGSGWPSFSSAKDSVGEKPDYSLGMKRTEVLCNTCGGHLGHVFNDGPTETGQRYCINSAAMNFIPEAEKKANETRAPVRSD